MSDSQDRDWNNNPRIPGSLWPEMPVVPAARGIYASSHMQQGYPAVLSELTDGDVAEVVDSQLATSSLMLPSDRLQEAPDSHFATTEEFWRALLTERARAHRTVTLHNVLLSEWFPRSPGLYHTPAAAWAREEAQGLLMPLTTEEESIYLSSSPSDPVVHNLNGKLQMLRGGIGCIRLKERETAEGRLYFMSVCTSLLAHEGVPVALTPHDYGRYIDEVTERGALPCTITGKLVFLPDNMLSLYRDYSGVPYLYLLVSEVTPQQSGMAVRQGPPTASAAVLFRVDDPWPAVSAAYISFVAGRHGTLKQRLPWLEHYIGALHGGTVITDFDEQMARFPRAVFSLEKIATGSLDKLEIDGIARNLHINNERIRQLLARQQDYAVTLNNAHVGRLGIHVDDKFEDI